jgi:hypothetical protein
MNVLKVKRKKQKRGDIMNNKIYDVLKYVAQIVLPAIATLYFALAGIWGLPYGEEVVGTITAVDTFLGVILGISSANYNKTLKDKQN